MKSFFVSLAKKIPYGIAAIILFAALLVCLSRIFTPVLDKHKDEFERYASLYIHMPVSIKNVKLSWYQYHPIIDFNQVSLLEKETKKPLIQIKKVSLLFSLFESIWQWKPVVNGVIVVGTDVHVYQTSSGKLNIEHLPALNQLNPAAQQEDGLTMVAAGLSQLRRVILQNIDLHYTPLKGEKRFVSVHSFSLENFGNKHVVQGEGVLHQALPTEVTASLSWEGDMLHFTQNKANLYVYVTGLSLPQWISGRSYKGWEVQKGVLSAKFWATWRSGFPQKLQSSLQLLDVQLYSQLDKSTHTIHRLSGDFGWKRKKQQIIIAGENILVDLPSHLWPVTNFYVSLLDSKGSFIPQKLNIGYMDLHDVQTFLFSSPPLLSDVIQNQLKELQLKGSLFNIALTFPGNENWSDPKQIAVNGNFNQLSFLPWKKFPGMKNFSGAVKWDGKNGSLKIDSNRLVFDYATLFENPIHVNQLTGNLTWEWDQANNQWQMHLPDLQIFNDDTTAKVNANFTVPGNDKGQANMDVNADFNLQKANHITRYLPLHLFDAELVTWLKQAFLSGEVKAGHLVLRGPLADFPFTKQDESFMINGNISNIDFRYAPDWPILRNVNGRIAFTGSKMEVDVDKAEMLGIPLSKVHAVIPDLGSNDGDILQIESSEISANLAQGLNFIHSSPLEKSLGKMFNGVNLQGPMRLKLGLTIPLNNPDKTKVEGDLGIKNTEMNLAAWNLKLKELNGQLKFTEDKIFAKNLKGLLFDRPLQFNLTTIQKPNEPAIIQANFTNYHLKIADIENWLDIPLSQVVKGETDIGGYINFISSGVDIHLQSNLLGASINLIEPYGKKVNEERKFATDVQIKEKEPLRIKLSYSDLLNAALLLEFKQNNYHLLGANLHLGPGEASLPLDRGLYITGEVKELDWDKLKNFAKPATPAVSRPPQFSLSLLQGIDVRIGQVKLNGQTIKEVGLKAKLDKNNWNIHIASPDIVGQLILPLKLSRENSIDAKFEKLKLYSTTDTSQTNSLINVKTLPTIIFTANQVTYDNFPIGQITFKATPSNEGMTIQTLRITSPRINVRASGNWIEQEKGKTQTNLQGIASSSQVSALLNSFDVHNFTTSGGELRFNLNWQGAPYAPSLASLNGNASLSFDEGRIIDIGRSNNAKMDLGKMLSIFSLQTLPRRLLFNFSDVYQKGYSFDSVRGDFNIQDGNLFTRNLRFEGPVAGLNINGRIGLNSKDYNFTLTVSAHVTSSLPVAATLLTAGNPLVGLGAFALNTVIGASRVTTYYYRVTGPWDNPKWESVSSP